MKNSFLSLIYLSLASFAFGASETEALYSKFSISGAVKDYAAKTDALDKEHAKAQIALNEKFLAELSRAKSSALKSENLAAANIFDTKIKEVQDSSASLKFVLDRKVNTSTVPAPASESVASSEKRVAKKSGAAFTTNIRGGAASILAMTLSNDGNNPTEEQKEILTAFKDGKVVVQGGNGKFYYFVGNKLHITLRDEHEVFPSVSIFGGKLTAGAHSLDLSTATKEGINGKFGRCKFVARDTVDAKYIPEEGGKELDFEGKSPSGKAKAIAKDDPNNTAFGRRQ